MSVKAQLIDHVGYLTGNVSSFITLYKTIGGNVYCYRIYIRSMNCYDPF